jgi:hypothetical protein
LNSPIPTKETAVVAEKVLEFDEKFLEVRHISHNT